MIGSNIYITNRFSYGTITPQFKQVIDYAKSLNYTTPQPGTTLYKALDAMVGSYVSEGVWNEWDIYYQFGFKDTTLSNFSKIDWRRLTTGSYQGGLAFVNGGIKGGTGNGYFDTNFTPSTQGSNYQQTNASRFLYLYEAGTTSSLDGSTTLNNSMTSTSTTNQRINNTGGLNASITFAGDKSMKSIHRVSATEVSGSNSGIFQQGRTTPEGNLVMPANSQLVIRNASIYGDGTISMYAMGSHLVDKVPVINNIFNQYTSSIQL